MKNFIILFLIFMYACTEKTVKIYDKEGKVSAQYTLVNGVKNGPIIEYYDNGNIMTQGVFLDGKKNDYWTFYDKSGRIDSVKEYIMLYPFTKKGYVYNNIDSSEFEFDNLNPEDKESYLNRYMSFDDSLNVIRKRSSYVDVKVNPTSLGDSVNFFISFYYPTKGKDCVYDVYVRTKIKGNKVVYQRLTASENEDFISIKPYVAEYKGQNFFQAVIVEYLDKKKKNISHVFYIKEPYNVE